MQNNELKMNYLKPNCFEKTKEAWGIFSFFSSTNVETKNVCPIAYNGWVFAFVAHADTSILADASNGNDANTLLPAGADYLPEC